MGNGALSWRSGLHRRHPRSVLRLQNEYLPQLSPAAPTAQGDVDPGQTQQHLPRRFRLTRFGGRLVKQPSAEGELASPAAIGEEPVMAQPGEAARKHMQQEAPDELVGVEAHHLDLVAIGVVAPPEANMLAVEVDEAMAADGDLVGVAPEIGQDLPGAGERGLAVDHPVVRSQRGLQALELAAVVATGGLQPKLAVAVRGAEEVEILAAEDLRERGCREQEALAGGGEPALPVRAQAAVGDDAVNTVPLDRMSTARVRRWFDAFSQTAPANANRGLEALRQIMNFAIACGYADANPAAGIALNPRPKLTRFLSREEIARLHRALDGLATRANRHQVDIIRLLLLTGCRSGEIVRLRWSELRDDKLMLEESKTGPRGVPLNSQARRILARQPQNGSPFVFPSPRDPSRPRYSDLDLWHRVRKEAGIGDARLHDLRHTYASHAVLQGVPLPVVSRLLGHKRPSMTLRYAHVGDRETEPAAERVGEAIARVLHGGGAGSGG